MRVIYGPQHNVPVRPADLSPKYKQESQFQKQYLSSFAK